MGSDNNPVFSNTRPDLGEQTLLYGLDKPTVDKILLDSQTPSIHICIICGNTAKYKVISKFQQFNTTEIQDRGYICEYCVEQKYLDAGIYALRKLK